MVVDSGAAVVDPGTKAKTTRKYVDFVVVFTSKTEDAGYRDR